MDTLPDFGRPELDLMPERMSDYLGIEVDLGTARSGKSGSRGRFGEQAARRRKIQLAINSSYPASAARRRLPQTFRPPTTNNELKPRGHLTNS